MTLRPRLSPLFPYTTLFRSAVGGQHRGVRLASDAARLQGQLAAAPHHFLLMDIKHVLFFLPGRRRMRASPRSEEHTSELQSPCNLVCRLLLEKKNVKKAYKT